MYSHESGCITALRLLVSEAHEETRSETEEYTDVKIVAKDEKNGEAAKENKNYEKSLIEKACVGWGERCKPMFQMGDKTELIQVLPETRYYFVSLPADDKVYLRLDSHQHFSTTG